MANQNFSENRGENGGSSMSPPKAPGTHGGKAPAFKVKPGFNTGVPGKKGPDRSAGVKRARVHVNPDGI